MRYTSYIYKYMKGAYLQCHDKYMNNIYRFTVDPINLHRNRIKPSLK